MTLSFDYITKMYIAIIELMRVSSVTGCFCHLPHSSTKRKTFLEGIKLHFRTRKKLIIIKFQQAQRQKQGYC